MNQKIHLHRLSDTLLLALNDKTIFVLCIRNPFKSLISWHRMHHRIATTDINPNHFAKKESDFYATCTIEEYYNHYAKNLLKYDFYLEQMLKVIPVSNIIVFSQEFMARDIRKAARIISLKLGLASSFCPQDRPPSAQISFADRATINSPSIQDELADINKKVYEIITTSGIEHFV